MVFSRSFKVSLLISTLLHLGAFAALGHETVARKILASPEPLSARKSESRVVRFELVEGPPHLVGALETVVDHREDVHAARSAGAPAPGGVQSPSPSGR